jgi:hypothetical protein
MLIIIKGEAKVKAKKILNLNLDFNLNTFISAKIHIPECVRGYKFYKKES